ncbi:MAG: FHA domain-containing protein [Calothrix sp. SM1_5_4]|nr:FHA domain-containing protein [Calothrix sp. SM1_5_4]
MKLGLKLISGPRAGETHPLSPDLVIGRQDAGINLNDPRVSSVHARIHKGEAGAWILQDNNSKNGVRNRNGDRIDILELGPGVRFEIGETLFEVVEIGPTKVEAAEPIVKAKPKKMKVGRYWNEILAQFLDQNSGKFADKVRPVSVLEPALVLEFVRGTQVHTKWILGFGPRKVGSASADLPIWEPGAPATCFEILPGIDGLVFRTDHPDLVRLNGQEIDSHVLRMGDTIKINDTLIEVDFVE